ncbi:MAG: DUF5710 domain-containing protein [Clostridium sp.]|nr:DUF5710 domain-containing protein [Clostridium sp.]
MLYLNVPYIQKDAAKALGARWDGNRKQWYVEDKNEYNKFVKWMGIQESQRILCDYIYIVEAKRKCFSCKRETKVISWAAQNYCTVYRNAKGYGVRKNYDGPRINFFVLEQKIKNEQLETFLKERFNYYYSYSKTINESYCVNHCQHCKKIQGDFFLHEEIDGPFMGGTYLPPEYHLYKIFLSEDGKGAFEFTGNGFKLNTNHPVELIDDFKINPAEL